MDRSRRRPLLALLVVGVLAACSYTHVSEPEVRSQAAEQMDCDPQLIKLETIEGPGSGIARYEVRGCGRTATFDCTEQKSVVRCKRLGARHGEADDGSGDGAGEVVAGAAAGCACGSLFGRSKSDDESSTSSSPSPMSTTPQRNKR